MKRRHCIEVRNSIAHDLQTQDDAHAFQCVIGYATSLYLVTYQGEDYFILIDATFRMYLSQRGTSCHGETPQ